jgi:A/G-specific adenine glycosylase
MKDPPAEPPELDDDARDGLRAALLAHYDRHARDLPWRGVSDPYRVLVSEVMLQQTRVETVRRYYDAWLDRFPDLRALAAAEQDEVLKAWEGLGYYRRARNLHRAARVVREEWAGAVPGGYEDLRTLPGIGEYTAGAVASIAFGAAVPAVDGNVRRVLSRLFDVPRPSAAWLRRRAAELVDPDRPGDWNQALMELGATVCTPRSPSCPECPLAPPCRARARGTQAERPERREVAPSPTVDIALAVMHARDRVLLVRRPTEGLLGGMWAFPERELDVGARASASEDAHDAAMELVGAHGLVAVRAPVELPLCRHKFTHLEARYRPWAIEVDPGPVLAVPPGRDEGSAWVEPGAPGQRAMPRAQQKVLLALLDSKEEIAT